MIALRVAMREMWRAKQRLLLLAFVLAMQVMAIGGTLVFLHSFLATRDHYYETLDFADLEVGFAPAADNELPALSELRKIPGVRGVARRYIFPGTVEDTGASPWPVLVVYLDPGAPEVNAIAVLEGANLDAGRPSGVVVDRSFADHHHLKVGDAVVVNPYRFATRFTVSGIGLSPEYLAPAVDPGFLLPAKGSLGIVYAPRAQLDALFVDRLYNDLVFTFQPGADPEATRAAVVGALSRLEVHEVVPRRSHVGYRLLEELLRPAHTLTPILAVVVGLLAATVAYVLMTRIIVGQRREIGALLAIGFPPWHFMLAFLFVALAPGVVGAAFGVFLAREFGRVHAHDQAEILGFPEPILVTPYAPLAVAAAFAIMVTLAGAAVPLMGVLRLTPAAAIRGGREIVFRGLPRVFEALATHGPASVRYAIRNVLRRARLSMAVVTLVCAGVAAPSALLTISSSGERWSEDMVQRIRWDATVSFRAPLKPDALATVISTPGLREFEAFAQGRATLSRNDAPTHEVRVRGLAVPARLDVRRLVAGRELSSDDALEAIVNETLARDERSFVLGESIRLVSPEGHATDLRIVGLIHDDAASTVHVPIKTAQRTLGLDDRVTGMFVRYGPMSERAAPPPMLPDAGPRPETAEVIDLGDEADTRATQVAPAALEPKTPETALLREEMVVGIQSKADAAATARRFMQEHRRSIAPFLAIGMFFAFAAIASVMAILLLEREGEYATLRAMGYGRASIVRIVFLEAFVLSLLGLSAALVAWLALAAVLIHRLSATLFPLPLEYRAMDFVAVALPTLAFLALVAAAGVRSVMRIDLREVLCSRAIG